MDVDNGWDKADDDLGNGIQCVPPPSSPITPGSSDFQHSICGSLLKSQEPLICTEALLSENKHLVYSEFISSNLETIPEHREVRLWSNRRRLFESRSIFESRSNSCIRKSADRAFKRLTCRKLLLREYASVFITEQKPTSVQDIALKLRSLEV